jgi:Lrp/AsnC family leucine-responsive transcriptional regulator
VQTLEIDKLLDETGWRLLEELQENARLSYSELGLRVGLSSPAVAERMRRMEEAGLITGYHAEVKLPALGLPVTAVIRLVCIPGQNCSHVANEVNEIPEVIECYRVTGSDSVVVTVAATSVDHLEHIIDGIMQFGSPTTALVLSNPRKRRTITQSLITGGLV